MARSCPVFGGRLAHRIGAHDHRAQRVAQIVTEHRHQQPHHPRRLDRLAPRLRLTLQRLCQLGLELGDAVALLAAAVPTAGR